MKKDYIFNTIAGLIDASEAVIMSMIITRTTGLADAGYVTIAFAVGILLLTIGKYGVYGFQVTDHRSEYKYSIYLYSRIITVFIMILCLLGYLAYGHFILNYQKDKIYIVLFIGLIYATEAVEDLFRANCQIIGKLYIGSLIFIFRWSAILITFGISLKIFHNTAQALCIAFFLSCIVFLMCCYTFRAYIGNIPTKYISLFKDDSFQSSNSIINLLNACFPIFLSTFLSFYIVNSSKYAIERFMSAETQACFGFVAMPVFSIGLLNSFIYQPQLVNMSSKYNDGQIHIFIQRVYRQYFIIAILTALCITGAYFGGIPFLSILYHTDLSNYLPELMILLLGGGFLALSGYQGIILTIMRRQKFQLYGYIPVALLAFLFVGQAVKKYGTIGAASSYLVLIIILCILYEVFIRLSINKFTKT